MTAAAMLIRRQVPAVVAALQPACKGGEPIARRDGTVECRQCRVAMPDGYRRVPGLDFKDWCKR